MRSVPAFAFACLVSLSLCVLAVRADETEARRLADQFQPAIRPLLARYCEECHSAQVAEADLDLTKFAAWADVRKNPEAWQKVGEMLDSGQMPPKDASQPTDAERQQLRDWVRSYLMLEAKARAGDPGRVVLRRLSNAEYTYTLRDLTGVASLDPAREFPVDGAAGEGFSNTGNALVMSPALVTKYLDAAKEVSQHAVLLADGFRWSPHTTRQDWTNETLDRIRAFYARYTESTDGERVNLQGVIFNTNGGGRLPIEKYLAATLAEREALATGAKTIDAVARERGLNAKYLRTLYAALTSDQPSILLDPLRARWRSAKPEEAGALAADIVGWQKQLWRFTSVGHIGKVGGPKRWMKPVEPLTHEQTLRYRIPASESEETILSFVLGDGGDGSEHDLVLLQRPRLVAPGRPEIDLRDVRELAQRLTQRRTAVLAKTAQYLAAAGEASAATGELDVATLAEKHSLDAAALSAWLAYLGVGEFAEVKLEGHFASKLPANPDYDFIRGWGAAATPLIVANSSDRHVRIPGNMKPHSVAVHPSPTHRAAVGWRSPLAGKVRVEGTVAHAHPECGNGVTWTLELRRGNTRLPLAAGVSQGARPVQVGPVDTLAVREGDVLSLLVGPRGGNHSCDLTAVDFRITDAAASGKSWDLAADISGNIHAGNPHDDRHGNPGVWHFYAEPDSAGEAGAIVPPGSLLAKWQSADAKHRPALAAQIERLLTSPAPTDKGSPEATLHRQLASLSSPLLQEPKVAGTLRVPSAENGTRSVPTTLSDTAWSLDPALFGKTPGGESTDAASLCLKAPTSVEIRLPTDLVAGYELVTTATLHPSSQEQGSAQVQLFAGKLPAERRGATAGLPLLVGRDQAAHRRIADQLAQFRELFPPALCYTKIVPVDEVVTLTLYYREDDHLARLMLEPAEQAELDRLWSELRYVSHDAIQLVDALQQLIEYATQDSDPTVFEPLREPFQQRADAFRKQLSDSEPAHLAALLDFAARAYRRPLTESEREELRALYYRLRGEGIAHDDAFRLTLARVLVAPAFLYKIEKPVEGAGQGPVTDAELATRLSYFLWSSCPDDELLRIVAAPQTTPGAPRLSDPQMLRQQLRRMLADPKTRRLATEFACQWLQVYDFDQLDEKSERHFPEFAELRGPMYEETIRFFTDLLQRNGSVLELLDADHTFLNERLARHYGIEGVSGDEWRKVEGVKRHGRGGILAQGATLAKQSGASRTSPILRGNWVSEVLLGERLPRPPPGIPPLPEEETATELTVRELTERHGSDPKCAVCHVRIDPLGFALENYDAIGRRREKDSAGRTLDVTATTMDGAKLDGLDGLRSYLLTERRDTFVRQFCRKLLGYSLGRSVQLSDEPLLDEMQATLKRSDYRIHSLVEMIVLSPQFREIRGRETAYEE